MNKKKKHKIVLYNRPRIYILLLLLKISVNVLHIYFPNLYFAQGDVLNTSFSSCQIFCNAHVRRTLAFWYSLAKCDWQFSVCSNRLPLPNKWDGFRIAGVKCHFRLDVNQLGEKRFQDNTSVKLPLLLKEGDLKIKLKKIKNYVILYYTCYPFNFRLFYNLQ